MKKLFFSKNKVFNKNTFMRILMISAAFVFALFMGMSNKVEAAKKTCYFTDANARATRVYSTGTSDCADNTDKWETIRLTITTPHSGSAPNVYKMGAGYIAPGFSTWINNYFSYAGYSQLYGGTADAYLIITDYHSTLSYWENGNCGGDKAMKYRYWSNYTAYAPSASYTYSEVTGDTSVTLDNGVYYLETTSEDTCSSGFLGIGRTGTGQGQALRMVIVVVGIYYCSSDCLYSEDELVAAHPISISQSYNTAGYSETVTYTDYSDNTVSKKIYFAKYDSGNLQITYSMSSSLPISWYNTGVYNYYFEHGVYPSNGYDSSNSTSVSHDNTYTKSGTFTISASNVPSDYITLVGSLESSLSYNYLSSINFYEWRTIYLDRKGPEFETADINSINNVFYSKTSRSLTIGFKDYKLSTSNTYKYRWCKNASCSASGDPSSYTTLSSPTFSGRDNDGYVDLYDHKRFSITSPSTGGDWYLVMDSSTIKDYFGRTMCTYEDVNSCSGATAIHFYIDTEAPTISITLGIGGSDGIGTSTTYYTRSSEAITITYADNIGIEGYNYYATYKGKWCSNSGTTCTEVISEAQLTRVSNSLTEAVNRINTPSSPGTYYLWLTAVKDYGGLYPSAGTSTNAPSTSSSDYRKYKFIIDDTAPTLEVGPPTNGLTSGGAYYSQVNKNVLITYTEEANMRYTTTSHFTYVWNSTDSYSTTGEATFANMTMNSTTMSGTINTPTCASNCVRYLIVKVPSDKAGNYASSPTDYYIISNEYIIYQYTFYISVDAPNLTIGTPANGSIDVSDSQYVFYSKGTNAVQISATDAYGLRYYNSSTSFRYRWCSNYADYGGYGECTQFLSSYSRWQPTSQSTSTSVTGSINTPGDEGIYYLLVSSELNYAGLCITSVQGYNNPGADNCSTPRMFKFIIDNTAPSLSVGTPASGTINAAVFYAQNNKSVSITYAETTKMRYTTNSYYTYVWNTSMSTTMTNPTTFASTISDTNVQGAITTPTCTSDCIRYLVIKVPNDMAGNATTTSNCISATESGEYKIYIYGFKISVSGPLLTIGTPDNGAIRESTTPHTYYSKSNGTFTISVSDLYGLKNYSSSSYYRYKWCDSTSGSGTCTTTSYGTSSWTRWQSTSEATSLLVSGSVSTPTAEGTYYLYIEGDAKNYAGLYTSTTHSVNSPATTSSTNRIFKFVIDDTGPYVANISTYSGDTFIQSFDTTYDSTIYAKNGDTLKVTLSDAAYKVKDGAYLAFGGLYDENDELINPIEVGYISTPTRTIENDNLIYSFTVTTSSLNDTMKLRFYGVEDAVGNIMSTIIYNFVFDNTTPSLTVSNPATIASSTHFAKPSIDLTITYTDEGNMRYSTSGYYNYVWSKSTTATPTTTFASTIDTTTASGTVSTPSTVSTNETDYWYLIIQVPRDMAFAVPTYAYAISSSSSGDMVNIVYRFIIDATAPSISFSSSYGRRISNDGIFYLQSLSNTITITYTDNIALSTASTYKYIFCSVATISYDTCPWTSPLGAGLIKYYTYQTMEITRSNDGKTITGTINLDTNYCSENEYCHLFIYDGVKDMANNYNGIQGSHTYQQVYVDTINPVITSYTLSGYNGCHNSTYDYCTNNISNLKISYQSTEEKPYEYRINGYGVATFNYTNYNSTYLTNRSITITGTQGGKNINLTIYDRSGRSASKTITIYYDTTAPTINNFEAIGNAEADIGYTKQRELSVNLNVSDALSGVNTYKITDSYNETSAVLYNISTIKPTSITLPDYDGNHLLTLQVCDCATNCSTSNFTIILDRNQGNSPTISHFSITGNSTALAHYTNQATLTVHLTAQDGLSGIKNYTLQVNNVSISSPVQPTTTSPDNTTFDLSSPVNGTTYTVKVIVRDRAGNDVNATYSMTYDRSSPSTGISYVPFAMYGTTNYAQPNRDFTFSYYDSKRLRSTISSDYKYVWSKDSSATVTTGFGTTTLTTTRVEGTITTPTDLISIDENDPVYLIVEVPMYDAAGNLVSTNSSYSYSIVNTTYYRIVYKFYIDDVAPTLTVGTPENGSIIYEYDSTLDRNVYTYYATTSANVEISLIDDVGIMYYGSSIMTHNKYKWCDSTSYGETCTTTSYGASSWTRWQTTANSTITNITGTITTPTQAGTYFLWIYKETRDYAGHYVINSTNIDNLDSSTLGTRIFKFVIDDTAPTLEVTTPSGGAVEINTYYAHANTTTTLTYTELIKYRSTTMSDYKYIWSKNIDATPNKNIATSIVSNSISATINVPSTESVHRYDPWYLIIKVASRDAAGNVVSTNSYSSTYNGDTYTFVYKFFIDDTAPTVGAKKNNDEYIYSNGDTIYAKYEDEISFISYDTVSNITAVTVNFVLEDSEGNPLDNPLGSGYITFPTTTFSNTVRYTTFSIATSSYTGLAILKLVNVSDLIGNTSPDFTITIYIDNTQPTVNISAYNDGGTSKTHYAKEGVDITIAYTETEHLLYNMSDYYLYVWTDGDSSMTGATSFADSITSTTISGVVTTPTCPVGTEIGCVKYLDIRVPFDAALNSPYSSRAKSITGEFVVYENDEVDVLPYKHMRFEFNIVLVAPQLTIEVPEYGSLDTSGNIPTFYAQSDILFSIEARDAYGLMNYNSSEHFRYKWCDSTSGSGTCTTTAYGTSSWSRWTMALGNNRLLVDGYVFTPSAEGTYYLYIEGTATSFAGYYLETQYSVNNPGRNSNEDRIFKFVIDNTAPTIIHLDDSCGCAGAYTDNFDVLNRSGIREYTSSAHRFYTNASYLGDNGDGKLLLRYIVTESHPYKYSLLGSGLTTETEEAIYTGNSRSDLIIPLDTSTNGSKEITLTIYDRAGNASDPLTFYIIYDTIAPTISVDATASFERQFTMLCGGVVTTDAVATTVTVSDTNLKTSTVDSMYYYMDFDGELSANQLNISEWKPVNGSQSFTYYFASDRTYYLYVAMTGYHATDKAGNSFGHDFTSGGYYIKVIQVSYEDTDNTWTCADSGSYPMIGNDSKNIIRDNSILSSKISRADVKILYLIVNFTDHISNKTYTVDVGKEKVTDGNNHEFILTDYSFTDTITGFSYVIDLAKNKALYKFSISNDSFTDYTNGNVYSIYIYNNIVKDKSNNKFILNDNSFTDTNTETSYTIDYTNNQVISEMKNELNLHRSNYSVIAKDSVSDYGIYTLVLNIKDLNNPGVKTMIDYGLSSVNETTNIIEGKSNALPKTVLIKDVMIRNGNNIELVDIIIIDEAPELVMTNNGGSNIETSLEVTKGEELSNNLGMSFEGTNGERVKVETFVTLDGVRVKKLDTNKAGVYSITYIAKDKNGKEAKIVREVIVKEDEVKEVVKEVSEVVKEEKEEVTTSFDNTKEVKEENESKDMREEVKIVSSKTELIRYVKKVVNTIRNARNFSFKLFSKYFFKVYDG